MIKNVLLILQIIVSLSLIFTILLQAKGSGLSAAFGGGNSVYRSKRGVEKLFVYLTIFLAIAFLVLSVSQVLI